MAVLARGRNEGRAFLPILLTALLILAWSVSYSQEAEFDEEGRLILEEITIRGELRTPQAIFLMLKTTPNLSNVLLERSFLEDVVSPIYPGAFAGEPTFGSGEHVHILPWWVRYGSVAAFAGASGYSYSSDNEEQGLIFGVIAGLDLVANVILDLGGR
ncbi:hypothetical protein GF402_09695 [Candidatus Fermentibacteria bacterium]|nr:hypothetical protein [Candidatus Fermentibacteria bacterium]